jgi:hypothetical protein
MPKYLDSVKQKFAVPAVSQDNLSIGQLLAIIVPITSMITSIAWSIAVYLIVREKTIASVEVARLEYELKAYEYLTLDDDTNKHEDDTAQQEE